MSNFIVSARKYRPETFKSVVGQGSISTTLKSAITGNHLGHAYLFCGPRGVGKTTCARIFAKTINCQSINEDGEACNVCESCVSFNESRSYNIHELDAASNNTVDDIRSLNEQVRIPPQIGKYSVYIIDEVHMLSQSAFNAFLKTLEEPPAHAIFILATTEKHKIIPTILSRCQIFDFNRIKVPDAVKYLTYIAGEENIKVEAEALHVIAQKADGAMRDALSIFDQVVSFSGGNIEYKTVIENLNILNVDYYFKLTDYFLEANASDPLLIFDEILDKGFDSHNFINGLANHFRELLVATDNQTIRLLEVSDNLKEKYLEQSGKVNPDFLFKALEICSQIDLQFKASRNQRLLIELGLLKMANLVVEKKKLIVKEEAHSVLAPKEAKQVKNENSPQAKPDEVPQKLSTGPEITGGDKSEPAQNEENKESIKVRRSLVKSPVISIRDALKPGGIRKNPEQESNSQSDIEKNIEAEITDVCEDFDEKSLKKSWDDYAEKMSNKPRLYSSLKSRNPVLGENYCVSINFDNNDQLESFNHSVKHFLLNHLKRELKNSKIEIIANLKEQEQQGRRLYTSEERFSYLSKKNPDLLKLKHQFNLDFD